MIVKTCTICNTQFETNWDKKKTCSKECRYKSASITGTHQVTRICVRCKKEFDIPPAWLRKKGMRGSYCSRECRWGGIKGHTEAERKKATNILNTAIKYGTVKRKPCIICGKPDAQAHHHKGYKKENWLNVIWLCQLHHNHEHEHLRKLGIEF